MRKVQGKVQARDDEVDCSSELEIESDDAETETKGSCSSREISEDEGSKSKRQSYNNESKVKGFDFKSKKVQFGREKAKHNQTKDEVDSM